LLACISSKISINNGKLEFMTTRLPPRILSQSTLERLGITPIINGCGVYTDLGGSILSTEIWSALSQLNETYIDMLELLERSGEKIAALVGAEAARVTPGASAAIALSVAACIVARQGQRGEQLPDITGLKGEIILQRKQSDQYRYLAPVKLTGAQLKLVGDSEGATRQHVIEAINSRTGAIFVPAHLDSVAGCVRLGELLAIGREHKIPVVVDAAYMNFPPEHMRSYAAYGADLTCFSAKYFGGPNAGGFVSGSKAMIAAVRDLEFTRHESGDYRRFGRAFKMGRYEVAAVQLALENWFTMDHQERLDGYANRAKELQELLRPQRQELTIDLACFTLDERLVASPVNAVVLRAIDSKWLDLNLMHQKLAEGNPSIRVVKMKQMLVVVTETLRPGEEYVIAKRIAETLE
jgi:D-glucosaminate-6-phosphate ammonia-lyase